MKKKKNNRWLGISLIIILILILILLINFSKGTSNDTKHNITEKKMDRK